MATMLRPRPTKENSSSREMEVTSQGIMIGSMNDTQYTGSLNMGYGAVLSCTLLIVLSIIMALTKLATAKAQKAVGGDLGGV